MNEKVGEKVEEKKRIPSVYIVIGMAGVGKSTFIGSYNEYVMHRTSSKKAFIINLDPAVIKVPYRSRIDIRRTVDFKSIMSQYHLGPNGAILTSLNLFTTRFDQVLDLLRSQYDMASKEWGMEVVLVDTPGQLEAFTWSASGQLITESLASEYPATHLLYVLDAVKCQNPMTFMSNMLYAVSIFYRMRRPMILVLNKADAVQADKVHTWLSDIDEFLTDLGHQNSESYMSTFTRSLALVLESFYHHIPIISVSSIDHFNFNMLHDIIMRTAYADSTADADKLSSFMEQVDLFHQNLHHPQ